MIELYGKKDLTAFRGKNDGPFKKTGAADQQFHSSCSLGTAALNNGPKLGRTKSRQEKSHQFLRFHFGSFGRYRSEHRQKEHHDGQVPLHCIL